MHIAIIGAGPQGRDFALACAAAGHEVTLEDVMPANLRALPHNPLAAGIHTVLTVEDAVRSADFAIDFVPDELESKLEIWSLIDRMAPPHTILCTPSASLSITDLASCTYRPGLCLMARGPLTPGGRIALLHTAHTGAAALKLGVQLFQTLGLEAAVQHDPDLPQLLKNMNAASLT